MAGEFDVLRTEGAPRLLLELFVAMAVLYIVFALAIGPWLRTAAPDVFAGGVDYGRWDHPDSALEYTHLGYMVTTLGTFLYWQLVDTELGRQFAAAYRAQR